MSYVLVLRHAREDSYEIRSISNSRESLIEYAKTTEGLVETWVIWDPQPYFINEEDEVDFENTVRGTPYFTIEQSDIDVVESGGVEHESSFTK